MSSRDAILSRIRAALADAPPVDPPPVAEVWPRENPQSEQLAERFASELEAVRGEVVRCRSVEDARGKLAELSAEAGWNLIGAVDRPACRELASGLPAERIAWAEEGWNPREMAELSAGIVAAEYLLADSGTCVIASRTPEERLMCFLPPACVVIGRVDQLAEHMPAAWDEIAAAVADPQRRGEVLLITGPSRTADIEKILILGVHGPKRLVVILVG